MHNAKSIDTTHTNRTVQHKKKWFYTLFGHYLPFGPPLLTACAWHKQWHYKGTKKNPFQQHFRSPFQGFFPDKPCRGKTRSPPSRLGLKVKRLKVKSKHIVTVRLPCDEKAIRHPMQNVILNTHYPSSWTCFRISPRTRNHKPSPRTDAETSSAWR